MSKPEPPPPGSFVFGGTRMHIVNGKPRVWKPLSETTDNYRPWAITARQPPLGEFHPPLRTTNEELRAEELRKAILKSRSEPLIGRVFHLMLSRGLIADEADALAVIEAVRDPLFRIWEDDTEHDL